MVRDRFGNDTFMHLAALDLVTREQLFAAPAREHGGQLPAQVKSIAYAHVHAVAAVGRVQVAGISDQEGAACRIAIGNQLVRRPFVTAEDFNLDIVVQAQRQADQRGGV